MYGQFKDIPENIKKKIEVLYGISYNDWLKLSHIINKSFEKKRGEADKHLQLSSEKDIFNPFYLASFTEPKKVLEYLNLIDNDLEQRKAHEVAKKIDSTGSTNLKTLAVATSSFASGLESIGKASMRLNGGSSPMMNRIAYNPSYGKILSSALIENEDSAVRKLILNVVSTVSNQAPALAYGLYTGGAGYGFALGNQVTSDSIAEAVQNNKTIESGFVYGLAQTALELSLEKLFGGIASKISGKGTSSFVSKMMNKIDDVVGNKKVASLIKKTLSLSETGAGEFLQEFTQAMTDPMLRNIIYNENNTYSAETLTDALYQGLIGFFAGGVMAAPTVKASVSNVQYTKIGEMSNAKNVLKLCEDVGYRHSDSYSEVKNSVEKGKTVDNATLGRLSVEVTQAIYDNTHFTEEYMATIANLGTTEQIAELMFGGNTEAAVKFKEKYSSRSVVDEGLSREYNNEVSIDENNRGGTYESVETDLAEWGQGGHTGERAGTLQENLGRNNDQGRATRIEQGGSPGIRSGERGGNRKLTSEQSEGLKTTAIKNEDGTPKTVYHFTDNMEFDVFAKGDIGFHFGNETQATARGSIQNKNGRTITAYLDIKNPLNISTDIMSWRPRNLALKLLSDGTISVEQYRNILKMDSDDAYSYDDPAAIELRRILADKGYDGIVYQNMFEGDGESYIAFYPEQVIIINDGKGDGHSSSPAPQDENGESVFNISARGDRKDAVTRSIEKVTGHYSLNEHQKLLYEVGAQFGAKVRFANLDYVVEKEVKVRGADGRMQTVIKKITVSPEGQFDPDTNTITLNTNVKPYHRPVEYILKHEMTHSLEVDPESYNLFAKEVLGSEEFLRYAASKINPETEEAFGSADAWMQYIIKSYADKGASLGEGTEAQYKAKCEMVANFVGDMLFGGRGNISANLMAEISTEAKTGLLGWIQRFFEKVKQIFKGRPELTEIERLEQEFLKAARSVSKRNQNPAENKKTTTDEGDGVKYSIATDSAGKYVKVDTNQNIFDGKSVREMQEIARKLIRDNFRGKVLNVGEEGKAFVSKRSSDEYSYPANRRMNESLKESKMKAAPELDNLLSVSRFIEHQSDDGRHPQATGGWDVYSTRFEVGGTMFSGEVKIMVTDRGYLFHDITKIKRLPVNGGLTETSSAAASGNPSTDSITENGTPVNSNSMQQGVKYSLSDADAEYMSAVEKGDTKTAQRLATKAAKDSGYTQRVLHGTSSFGFVKLDVSHSDDKTSFFATDSAETARTYSKGAGVRKVGPLTDADVLRIKDEVYQKAKDYAAFCNSKLSNKAETILDSINEKIEESIIALKNGKSFSEIRKDFVEFLGLLDEKFIEDYYHDNYEGKLSPEEFYALPETEKLDDDISKRSRHIIKALTALDPSSKTGLYEMFANTSNMLEVECNGANWDNIPKNAVPRVNSLKHLLYANRRTWTTRSLNAYAKSLGYSGVIFNNLVDSGNGTNVAPSTVYAFFNPQEQVKSADPVTYDDNGDVIPLSERFNRNNDDIRYSLPEEHYAEYDKPITLENVKTLRSIGRKSVNDFTQEDIEKSQKWAYKFWHQLSTKSPFFRAWFGDWREYDISPANLVTFEYGENPTINFAKRNVRSDELNTDILVDETIINDSISYAKKNGDEKQIKKLLGKIDEILANGILLDTQISTHSSGNKKGSTQFMHYLYTPISINGAPFIAKLSVEEYDLTGKNRAYNLQRIEISEVSRAQYSQLIAENRGKYAYTSDALSVAQLFAFVKQKDNSFNPKYVDKHLVNENGTPKDLFHQTENVFTEFDTRRRGAGTSDLETPFGIFLKETDKDIGLKGKLQMRLFARMLNPLVVDNREQLVRKIKELSTEYTELYNKSKEIDNTYSKKCEDAQKAFNNYIIQNSQSPNRKSRQQLYEDEEFIRLYDAEDNIVDEWQAANRENDLKAKEALTKALRDNKFDGVIIKNDIGSFGRKTEAYIVLDNTQVKSAADNIGTFDKNGDIRFSLPDSDPATLLDRYENGEITRAEYLEAIRPKKGTNPVKIANLSDEDADTTPSLPQPKGKGDGDGESKLYDSLLESTLITDEVKTEIANDTYIKNYGTTTNKAELQAAAERLEQGGKEEVDSWRVRGENVSAVDVAEGIILLKQYQDAGDISGAIVIAERLREIASLSGQAVQAFSIIGRFTPEMMVAYAKHELGKAREKMVALKTDEWLEANKSRFELTEEEIRMITDNTILASKLQDGSRTKAILLGEVTTLLQNKLPPERGQAMRAWVRTSLLFNPKTQLRNVLGNATMVMPYVGSDMFGGLIDKAIATKTGVRTTGFDAKIFGKSFAEGMKKGAQETIDDYKRKIHTKQEELDRFETNRGSGKSFNELHTGKLAKQLNAVARALNEVDRLNSMFLELGDRPFFEFWFANELNTLMKLNKTETPTKEMVEQAKQIALQRTWQDNNRVTKAASGLRKALNVASIGGYGLGDVVLKFVKTPANIAKAMVEFSPVGFAPAMFRIKELNRAIKKGNFTPAMQKEAVRSFSNAVIGTAVYLLGYALIAAGALDISGDGDDDKDVSNFEKYVLGVPPYSFDFFGTRVTYTWNQPFGTVIATVAELMDESKKGTLDGWDVISTVGEVFTSQSFLQNLYEFFSKDDALTGLASLVISEPSAAIPTLFSQMASLTDPYRRTAYQSGSPIKSALNDVIYRIPVLRQMFLPKQVNTLGEENKNPQFLNPWFAFIDPSTQYPKSSSMVAQNIYELYEKTGDKTVMPRVAPYKVTIKGKTVNFSIDERNEIQRQMGAVSAEILGEMFASAEFEKLSEEEQTKAVAKVYEYAYAKIKAGLDIYDYDTLSQIVGTKKNGDPILSAERYSRLNDKARQMLVDEYFFSDDEIKCKGTPKKLAELFIKKIKK